MIEISEKEYEEPQTYDLAQISIYLHSYDDIFSVFDSRPYSERALSDDFLLEIKKASRDKETGKIELKFTIEKEKRNFNHEPLIKKRLHAHFKKHHELVHKEMRGLRKSGLSMTLFGVIMLGLSAYLVYIGAKNFMFSFIETLLAAGGWFTGWTGLDRVYYGTREIKPDYEFYNKMSKAAITFDSA